MPKRYRPPARRRKSKKHPRPNVPLPPIPVSQTEQPLAAPSAQRLSAPTLTPLASPQAKHVARDYSYVLGELRRIALMLVIIIGGLIITAASLRWF